MPPSATVKGNTSSGVVEKLCQDPRVVTLPGWSGAQAFGRDIPSAKVIFYDAGYFALETHVEEISDQIRSLLMELVQGGKF